jgi:hypothetical protein
MVVYRMAPEEALLRKTGRWVTTPRRSPSGVLVYKTFFFVTDALDKEFLPGKPRVVPINKCRSNMIPFSSNENIFTILKRVSLLKSIYQIGPKSLTLS